ncbi:hypothetical protein [Chryseobacterium sp. POE27]
MKLKLNLTTKATKDKFKKFYELIKDFKRIKIKDFKKLLATSSFIKTA